jgi:ABC-type glycerol-3-phosphate transport system substrate-binding protein
LDAFVQGTSAFFLGYSYHLPSIRARAPKLNLGIAKAPQISGNPEVNFANYWGWAVSKKTKSPDLAWGLAQFLTEAKNVPTFLEKAERPAARKALLQDQLENEDLGVFASQVLTAKSWYRGKDPAGAERAFILLMDQAPLAKDENELRRLLRNAEEQVAQSRR